MQYWGMSEPTAPDANIGRVYEYNFHGTLVYLTLFQNILFYALPGLGLLIGVAGHLVDRKEKRKSLRDSWPGDFERPPH
jgi:hypothetical protein